MEKDFVIESSLGQRRVVLKNRIDEIHRLSVIVEQFFQEHQLPPELLFKMNLISNIINYGYEDGREHQISVFLNLANGRLTVEIKDDVRAFDPLANPDPRLDAPLGNFPNFLLYNCLEKQFPVFLFL